MNQKIHLKIEQEIDFGDKDIKFKNVLNVWLVQFQVNVMLIYIVFIWPAFG